MHSINIKYMQVVDLIDGKTQSQEKDKHFQLLKEIITILKPIVDQSNEETTVCNLPRAKLAHALHKLALCNYKSQCITDCRKGLNESLNMLEGREMHHSAIGTAISSLTQLALLANEDDDQETALEHFEKANNLYTKYKSNKSKEPATPLDLFGSSDQCGWIYLEDLSSHNMYYQAQVLSAMGCKLQASNLFLLILHRSYHKTIENKVEWIRNVLNLCSIYMTEKYFKLAKRLLVVSFAMMEDLTDDDVITDGDDDKATVLAHLKADVYWLLGAYCSQILENQRTDTLADQIGRRPSDSQDEMVSRVHFSPLDLSMELGLPSNPTEDYETSLNVVDKGVEWLEKARLFYTKDEHMSSHITLSQEISAIMKKMSLMEVDLKKRWKWYKKRITILDPITKLELGPAYQDSWRDIVLEIAEVYEAMVDMKAVMSGNTVNAETPNSPVNRYVIFSLEYYEKYVDSVRLEKSQKFQQAYVESVLSIHLCMARLWGKLQVHSKVHQTKCIFKAIQMYEFILEYCDKYEEQSTCFKDHLPSCRELRNLLIQRLYLMNGNRSN